MLTDHRSPSVDRTCLADGRADDDLRRQGYVVLDGTLPPRVVADLSALYRSVIDVVGPDTSGCFLPSMMIDRADLRARLWDGVREIAGPHLEPHFRPGTTEVFGGSFVSKPSAPNSQRQPHQDPTVFDESERASLSVWVPLTASSVDNGTIWVLPGSHRMGNHIRPPDVASFDGEVRDIALRSSVPVEVEAGQMVVIDGEVIHHSLANTSGAERVATICALRPTGASMRLVRSQGGAPAGVAEVYDVGTELYRSGNLVAPDVSSSRLVGRVTYRPATVDDLHRSLASCRSGS